MGWLLPADLLLLAFALYRRYRWPAAQAYFVATLLFGLVLALTTEVLSALRWLTPTAASTVSGGALLLLLGWHGRLGFKGGRAFCRAHCRWSKSDLLAWSFPAGVLAVAAFLALTSPPNTVDAFTYHLGRVIHWAQNKSLAPYPTTILRQIYQLPWAEEVVLWLHLLTGDDRFAALVQWWALLSVLIILPAFTRQLAPQVRPLWPLWLAATMPMVILQAASTQNDLVVSYWLVAFVFAVVAYHRQGQRGWLVAAGVAGGLALATKGTAYLWLWPWGLWALWLVWKRNAWREAALAAVLATVLVAGPLYRNTEVFGHPLGDPQIRQKYLAERHDWRAVASGVLRHLAVHATTARLGETPWVAQEVESLHQHVLHLSPSDPQTTSLLHTFHVRRVYYPSEDDAGNWYHLLWLILAALWALWRGERALRLHTAALGVAFVVFAGWLKWNPWVVRLHLPWFLLAVPVMAWALERLFRRRWWLAVAVLAVLVVQALPPLVLNSNHPLRGPLSVFHTNEEERLFRPVRDLREPYTQGLRILQNSQCDQIGLVATPSTLEYIFWYLLAPTKPHLRLEHLFVNNATAGFASRWPRFTPCALIVTRPDFQVRPRWQVDGAVFHLVYEAPDAPLFIYLREPLNSTP